MKSPIPMLLALGLGAALMAIGSKRKVNPIEDDEVPTSLDYNDPDLHAVLESEDEDGSSDD